MVDVDDVFSSNKPARITSDDENDDYDENFRINFYRVASVVGVYLSKVFEE